MKNLSTSGGRILVLLVLVVIGLVAEHLGSAYAKDIVLPALTTLFLVLGGHRPAGRTGRT